MCVGDILCQFGSVVAALLIVLDPLGAMPMMISLSSFAGVRNARKLTLRIVAGATLLLLFFTIAGTFVLHLFGITLGDMRIGGGLLLLIIALKIVAGGRFGHDDEESHQGLVVPLISPMIVGPGAITAAIVLARINGVWVAAGAVVAAMLISLVLFLSSRWIHRLIGDAATDLISRVMGVFVATIAISYIRVGIIEMIQNVR
jgi:multiple antibiotic resistance protein